LYSSYSNNVMMGTENLKEQQTIEETESIDLNVRNSG